MKTETPNGMIVLERTKKILEQMERDGACYFQMDDGIDDYNLYAQLKVISGDVGYELINVSNGYAWVIFNREAIKEEMAKEQ